MEGSPLDGDDEEEVGTEMNCEAGGALLKGEVGREGDELESVRRRSAHDFVRDFIAVRFWGRR